jgi:pimeloyl-ACP methyl ester carboxylesterase
LTQRYFGATAWNDAGENFSIQNHANDLGAFIHGLGLGPVSLVGWSYGGAACLAMAAQNPDLVKRMFLYEPALTTFVTDPEDEEIALEDRSAMSADAKTLADAGDLAGTVRMFMDGVNAEAGTFDSLTPTVRAMMIDNARTLPLLFAGPPPPPVTEADLRDLAIPVTLILGEQSRPYFRIAALAARALLPSINFKTIENARHLWPIQDPAAFSRLVLDFLDSA